MAMISVIVPVYKVKPYLRRCIDSILGQSFSDFELILVDDGSPDGCPAICDEYAAKDDRVHVIHQENGGLSAARNTGIEWAFANSDSQWLSFIDSDDWVHPEYLKRLLDAALEHQVSVSVCGYAETKGEEPLIKKKDIAAAVWTPEAFFSEHNVNATVAYGKLYQKKCYAEIRYPIGKIHEDQFTTYKILFDAEQIAVISSPLYFYYQNADGITKSNWSPKRLACIEAHNEQIEYFIKNGFHCAYLRSAKALLWEIATQIGEVSQLKPSHKKSLRQLKRTLRKDIRLYKSDLHLSISEDGILYERAYPICMKIYWLSQSALRRLRFRGSD